MKTQKHHLERQMQHSHDLMICRLKKQQKKQDKVAYIVGVVVVSAWLLLVAICFITA